MYGGTKTEMERLVKDAAKLDKSVDANSLSFGNIVKAIHAVQVKMDIYGTTQKEAEHTISGSLYSLKAAWGNLLPALINGGDAFEQCVDNLVDSAGIFFENIKPAIIKGLSGIGDLIEKIAPLIEKEFPKLVDELLPPLLKAATSLVKGLIIALPDIVKAIAKELPDIAKQLSQAIAEAFNIQVPSLDKLFGFFSKNSNAIVKAIPFLLGLVGVIKVLKGLSALSGIFGGGGKGDKKGGLFSGLTNTFKELAKTKPTVILKGMGNLAIIIGGFTLIAAAVMLVSPYIAQLSDVKSFIKLVAVMGVLGLVGTGLAKLAEIVGKIPIKTVLKGLANMAIMLVGVGALLLAATFVFKNGVDFKEMLKVAALIGIFGVVGAALSLFAGIVGVIPILVVLKGLANMAIVLVGMGALLFAATKVFANGVDFAQMFKVISLIGILGTVGTVLSIFAGIAGMIPIPVVLAGLTNITLVLGGITALIVAFGKLSEIKGFNEFISKGGATLANLFNQIGKIAGALIGGFGEGVSNSLPKIGENLSKFVTSLKPMFDMFKGVDMSGAGTFFSALGGFMLKMAGNDILSFFTGGTDFAKLGTDLTTFATNSQGFFNTVSTMPENGFTNATKLFNCLGGLKGLPKEGGVVSWFTGNINYANISSGLGQLANEQIVNFFNTVAKLPEKGFDIATKLFECLGGLKSLPKEGGVVGWFSGNVNYKNIATGLGQLSTQGVKNFFAMVSSLKADTFEKTKQLFEALGSIDAIPKEGGFWKSIGDKVTGNKTQSKLSAIANDLENFSEKTKVFFAQVNALNLSNLNGLWSSLKGADNITADVSKKVDTNINDIVKKISALPKKMGDGIKSSGSSLSEAVVSIWKDAVKASARPVNKLLDGANWILKQFGSSKRVTTWTPYAKGTNGHKGGNALVNDGRGAELVQMPNGNTFIPKGKNVLIPNAPKGMKVLPAEQTANAMGRKSPTFRYAKGTGNIDIWDYIDNAKGLIDSVSGSFVNYNDVSGIGYHFGKGMVTTVKGQMTAWAKKLYDEFGAKSLASYIASKGVEQWRSTVIRALKMEGLYSAENVKRTLYQMQTESGGNPRAINLWDSNAKKGIPSKGLMQVIDPTFKAYARAGYDKNIYDPLSNILAAIRYARARYGSLARAFQGHGYANGGIATKPSIFGEDGAEAAIPLTRNKRKQGLNLWAKTGDMLGVSLPSYSPYEEGTSHSTSVTENNTYSPVFNLTISGTNDDRTMARKVKRWVNEAIEETFDSYSRRNPKLREA